MLRFTFKQFELGGRFHVPLPKMTQPQMALLRQRLESIGFKTTQRRTLKATKARVTIVADPSGLCWANQDLADAIVPVVPEILKCEKMPVSLQALRNEYFASEKQGRELLLRLAPRMEFESLWDGLRAAGLCALTPDEQAVYSTFLSSSSTETSLLTDFPVRGCAVRRIGRRQYYDSKLEAPEAASTLRGLGSSRHRNSYLPRDSLLKLRSPSLPRKGERNLFEELGEWCFLSVGQTRQKL